MGGKRKKPDTFAGRLIRLRKAAGLTSYRLSLLSGISKQSLSQLQSGKSQPTLSTLLKLCNALDISLAEFDGLHTR
jgi:transcriptional regulator with XRE-family HTH domain